MKLITKHTDYAIRALVYLAGDRTGFIPAGRISDEENIPDKFLKRLLQELIRRGYLKSKEGRSGGVMLAKEPSEIRVLDVMKIFQGEFQISECMFRKRTCPNRRSCVLRSKVKVIENGLEARFAEITIDSLLKIN